MPVTCSSCLQEKSSLKRDIHCGICQRLICKECTQFLDEGFFAYSKKTSEDLKHTTYCAPCYDQKVTPVMESYLHLIKKAEAMHVFFKNEREVPIITKNNVKVVVEDCEDRRETLFKLAFLAAEQGFNSIVSVDLVGKKVITNGYQKTRWSGNGFPAKVRED